MEGGGRGVVDMQGGCLCLIVCPICLALSPLSPLRPPVPLLASLPSFPSHPPPPPPPPAHTLHCAAVSPLPAGWQTTRGSSTPQQLVALFACNATAHMCASARRLPGRPAAKVYARAQCEHLLAPGAQTRKKNPKTSIRIRWLKGRLGLSAPPSPF